MTPEEREAGLLRLVAQYRERECRAVLDAARAQARSLVRDAYREGRTRLHGRVLAERATARAAIHGARAERDTRRRAGAEGASTRLLALAWPRLERALAARWADPAGRRLWAERAIAQARPVLPAGVWTIRHAPDWGAQERGPLLAVLAESLGSVPDATADPSIVAGLALASGGALLDASLGGLLRDRARIESRLLALLADGTDGLPPAAGRAP